VLSLVLVGFSSMRMYLHVYASHDDEKNVAEHMVHMDMSFLTGHRSLIKRWNQWSQQHGSNYQ